MIVLIKKNKVKYIFIFMAKLVEVKRTSKKSVNFSSKDWELLIFNFLSVYKDVFSKPKVGCKTFLYLILLLIKDIELIALLDKI